MLDKREALARHTELRELTLDALEKAADLADQRGSTVSVDGVDTPRGKLLRDTAGRMRADRFTLAVVGEFSRGKSTLINALLGRDELLPTAIEPNTATIAILTNGPEAFATVRFEDGTEAENVPAGTLPQYLVSNNLDDAEGQSRIRQGVARLVRKRKPDELTADDFGGFTQRKPEPTPRADVSVVELQYPSDFLGDNIRLVDTPGIGSVNPRHGEATRRFIREADAVLFLINTDPVIGANECNFLTFLQDYVEMFLFVVTKVDRFNEADRERSLNYTKDTIVEFAGISQPKIFPVSATQALEGQVQNDPAKIAGSGFPEFVRSLDQFLIEGRGHRIVKEFVAATRSHLRELRQEVEIELQGIEMDLRELGRRVEQTRPELERARATRERILALLDHEIHKAGDLIRGSTGTDWIRLSATIREEVLTQIDECDWEQLQQAADIIPIFVREIVNEELRDKIDDIADHLADLRAKVIEESQQAIDDLNQHIAFEFSELGEISEDEFAFQLEANTFKAGLTQIGTITIGSTIALALASGFVFGGIGALVMLGGGLLAGSQVTAVFRNRARARIKDEIDEPLDELVDTILENLEKEVVENVGEFRQSVSHALERAISGVAGSLARLQEEAQSAELNVPRRKVELQTELQEIGTLESTIQKAQLFSV